MGNDNQKNKPLLRVVVRWDANLIIIPDKVIPIVREAQQAIDFLGDVGERPPVVYFKNEGSEPYQRVNGTWFVHMNWAEKPDITIGPEYYASYMLGICLLEYVAEQERFRTVKAWSADVVAELNEHIWRGIPPGRVQGIVEQLRAGEERGRILVGAIQSIWRAVHGTSETASEAARWISGQINERGISGDHFDHLVRVCMAVGIDETDRLLKAGYQDDESFWKMLVEALAYEDSQTSRKLIARLAEAGIEAASEYQDKVRSAGDTSSGSLSMSFSAEDRPTIGRIRATTDERTPIDVLEYTKYAKALSCLIVDKDTETPAAICISSPWGRGKSTLLDLIECELDAVNDSLKRSWRPLESDVLRSKVIRFNAWRYADSDGMWKGFLTSIMRSLDDGFRGKWHRLRLAWKLNTREHQLPLTCHLATFLLIVLLLVVAVIFFPVYQPIAALVIGSGAIAAYRVFFAGAVKLLSHPHVEKLLRLIRMPDHRKPQDLAEKITSHVEIVTDEYMRGFLTSTVRRFVVMIDDLDRCNHEQILQTLETMRHLLSMRQFVFVIALEAKVLRKAIGSHYCFMAEKPDERDALGQRYLDKLIHVAFRLPDLTESQLRKLLSDQLFEHIEHSHLSHSIAIPIDIAASKQPPRRRPSTDSASSSDRPPAIPRSTNRANAGLPRISEGEKDAITIEVASTGINLEPRLAKRLLNVYMVARHLHLLGQQEKGIKEPSPPSRSFIRWLALSFQYPFESAALVKWLTQSGWRTLQSGFFAENGDLSPEFSEAPAFESVDDERLKAFFLLYGRLDIKDEEIRDFNHITSCFNLALD